MKAETERKYLVDWEKWNGVDKPADVFIRQGYLLEPPFNSIYNSNTAE